ncbi:hypothetical protein L1987_46368 [Smallanthus sonchifolius]|uniref:Uncharacterized protein n=1 Tax=Smallanthus sonchifolius TaxID=185202 RepID=A0ACB9FZD8_9ASTR|nr:hypothetical protein L1987_46368 [Smallanthus sonchifolius]
MVILDFCCDFISVMLGFQYLLVIQIYVSSPTLFIPSFQCNSINPHSNIVMDAQSALFLDVTLPLFHACGFQNSKLVPLIHNFPICIKH